MIDAILIFSIIGIVSVKALMINVFTNRLNILHHQVVMLKLSSREKKPAKFPYNYLQGDLELIHSGKSAHMKAVFRPKKVG